jgi:hypothetical protein
MIVSIVISINDKMSLFLYILSICALVESKIHDFISKRVKNVMKMLVLTLREVDLATGVGIRTLTPVEISPEYWAASPFALARVQEKTPTKAHFTQMKKQVGVEGILDQ